MSIKVSLRGGQQLERKLKRLANQKAVANEALGDWAKDEAKMLRERRYPPERPRQIYIRTGQLGRKWKAEKIRAGAWAIVNAARQRLKFYAPWVVGDPKGKRQARIHRRRWWVAREEIEAALPRLTKQYDRIARRIINR